MYTLSDRRGRAGASPCSASVALRCLILSAAVVCLRLDISHAQDVIPGVGEERIARVDFDDKAVVAVGTRGGEVFRIPHPVRPVDHDIELGGRFYYACSIYLMEIDPAARRITRRVPFPGLIEDIEKDGRAIQVKLKDWEGDALSFRPDAPGPILLPMDEGAMAAAEADANVLVAQIPGFNYKELTGPYKYEAARDVIRRGIFERAADFNPTNPWYHFIRGAMLTHIGDDPGARRAFRAAASTEGAPFFDYLRLSSYLAAMEQFAESEIAFERGLAEFVRAGYEPELLMSAEACRLYMSSAAFSSSMRIDSEPQGLDAYAWAARFNTGGIEDKDGRASIVDVDRSIELLERLWRLAPRCEGAGYAFAGMAEFLEEQGRSEDAEVWYARAQEAVRYSQAVGSRQFVNASAACLIALLVLLAVTFFKTFPAQRKDLAEDGGWFAAWKNPGMRFQHMGFAYAGRLELLGILFVAAAGFASSYVVLRSERAIRRSLAIPMEAKTGTWVHPRAIEILTNLSRESDAASLLYCIAQQQAGNDEEKIYGDLADAEGRIAAIAQNNLGVILARRGKLEKAERAFEKALSLDAELVEAQYNLGRSAASARVSRMRKYRPGEKIIALPDADILASAFEGAPRSDEAPQLLVGGPGKAGLLAWTTCIVTCIVGLLVLPFFLMRRELPQRRRGPLASLAYVVPWTSPKLAPWGGLVLASWIYCVIALVLVLHPGMNFLTTLAPEVKQAIIQNYGLAGGVFFGFEQILRVVGPLGVAALWAANLLFLLRASHVGPRQAGKGGVTERATVRMKVPAVEVRSAKGARPGRVDKPRRPADSPTSGPPAGPSSGPPPKEEEPAAKPSEKVEERKAEERPPEPVDKKKTPEPTEEPPAEGASTQEAGEETEKVEKKTEEEKPGEGQGKGETEPGTPSEEW